MLVCSARPGAVNVALACFIFRKLFDVWPYIIDFLKAFCEPRYLATICGGCQQNILGFISFDKRTYLEAIRLC